MQITVTKKELADKYRLLPSQLRVLMNVTFYPDLLEVGYNKYCNIIPPIVLEKFVECYGLPKDHLNTEI